ncbi:MAG: hypothetical protein J2P45_31200 [Candidatus Dormibacteraeota bacterium]|nr:hypothetical protein [Candidatus Dormibacteraeota bacterium]
MLVSIPRNDALRQEWDTLVRAVNAGFLRRWSLHDPRGPNLDSRQAKPPEPAAASAEPAAPRDQAVR